MTRSFWLWREAVWVGWPGPGVAPPLQCLTCHHAVRLVYFGFCVYKLLHERQTYLSYCNCRSGGVVWRQSSPTDWPLAFLSYVVLCCCIHDILDFSPGIMPALVDSLSIYFLKNVHVMMLTQSLDLNFFFPHLNIFSRLFIPALCQIDWLNLNQCLM